MHDANTEANPYLRSIDLKHIISIFHFSSWTLFGHLTTAGRVQVNTLIVFQAFGPIVGGSRAISASITNYVNLLSDNINTAIYSRILKSYSSKDYQTFTSYITTGSKITLTLTSCVALPIIFNTHELLLLWLGDIPDKLTIFVKLACVEGLILSMSLPLTSAARAPGKINEYELTMGGLQALIPAITFMAYFLGMPVYACYIVSISIAIAMSYQRLKYLKRAVNLNIKGFCFNVLNPGLVVCCIGCFPCI